MRSSPFGTVPERMPVRDGLSGSHLGLAALVTAFFVGLASPAASGDRFGTVRVDVAPMIAQGNGLQAEALRRELLTALQRSFADRIGGSGTNLVVRVRSLSLSPYAGSQGGRGSLGGGGPNDYLDGEALLVARDGRVLARHPQLSALPSSSGGAWYDPDSERRRVTAIAEHYAQWLRRMLPAE